MKQALILSLALFLLPVFPRVAINSSVAGEPQSTDPIQSIRQQYTAINKRLAKYKKVRKKLSGYSLEGGELVAYFAGQSVVKIVANHYGEGGKSVEEYYYSSGKLIFVFRKDQRYNKPLSGKVTQTAENRFYFENDRLIRWINETGKRVAPETDEYVKEQADILQTSSKFLEGVRSKNPTIEAE
jgi:hypothetical protein